MKDAKVQSAISHWLPRFVSNGVLLADFEDVTGSLERWDDWCQAWSRRAAVHERLGREALRDGWKLTAGEHLVRAGIYYHFAKFVFVQDVEQMRAAHMKAVECYRDGVALLRPWPGKRVAIPFEGKTIFGVLRGTGPVVIMAPGLDSTKEELHAYEEPFLARGMATLAIDGPGQGEAEYDIPICGDYERAAKAVCDWIEDRSDLDAKHIAIWGVSLGGYYAPRAAAYDSARGLRSSPVTAPRPPSRPMSPPVPQPASRMRRATPVGAYRSSDRSRRAWSPRYQKCRDSRRKTRSYSPGSTEPMIPRATTFASGGDRQE